MVSNGVLAGAGHAQVTAGSASRADTAIVSASMAALRPECYHNTCILLLATHASTIRTWVPPEAMPVPIQIVDSTQQSPVFHVALLAHHTADVLPVQWTRTSGTTRTFI